MTNQIRIAKRSGRVGVPYERRIYSGGWIADDTSVTVTWHHIQKTARIEGDEKDPAQLAKKLLGEIIRSIVTVDKAKKRAATGRQAKYRSPLLVFARSRSERAPNLKRLLSSSPPRRLIARP